MYTKSQQRDYFLKRYHNRRNKAIALLGNKCTDCGSTENIEIDHVNPEDKEFSLSKRWGQAWEKIRAELAKCQLLCVTCHAHKTKTYIVNKRHHGTTTMYRHGCRCSACSACAVRYNREYKKQKALSATG